MSFWSPSLNKINRILADLYPLRQNTERLVEYSGLSLGDIEFRDKGVDNWYVILREARKRGRISELIEFAIEDSQNKELADAYEEYRQTSELFGGGAPVLPASLQKFGRWLAQNWGKAAAALGGILGVAAVALGGLLVVAAAFVIYYFFVPTTVSGYISCDDSTPRHGERLEAATVVIEGTKYKGVTDAAGRFAIRVPRYLNFEMVEVIYGLEQYRFRHDELADDDHRVVRCHSNTSPVRNNISFEWWDSTPIDQAVITCQARGGIRQVKLYTLKPDGPIRKGTVAGDLFVDVVLLGGWQFLNAEVTRPRGEPEPWGETLREAKKRQWSFEMPGDSLAVGIQICLGTDSAAEAFSDATLSSSYYFQ